MCSLLVSSSRLSFSFSEEKKKKEERSLNEHQKQKLCVQKKMKINHFTHKNIWTEHCEKKIYLMGKLHLFLIRPVRRFKLTQLGDEAQLLFLLFFQVLLQDCTPLAHLRPKPIDTKVAAFFSPGLPY